MSYEPFLIADFRTGEYGASDPWLAPNQAFQIVDNVTIRRGILKKRLGSEALGRLPVNQTDENIGGGSGIKNYTGNLANTPIVPFSITFEDVTGVQTITDDGEGGLQGDIDPGGTNTIDYTTGAYDVTFLANTGSQPLVDYDYYTAAADNNIRGLHTFSETGQSDVLAAFDAKRMGIWIPGQNRFELVDDGGGTYDIWNSSALMWTAQYEDTLWMVDGASPVRTYDGTSVSTPTLQYGPAGTDVVKSAEMVFVLQERVILLRTTEGSGSVEYAQRARWSQAGDTTVWRDDLAGQGGFNDASTNERIISASFVSDRIVVFFEKSIWILSYTADPNLPFRWDRINSHRDIRSKFGTFDLDQGHVAIGYDDYTLTDGVGVQTFNSVLPDLLKRFDRGFMDKVYSARLEDVQQIWTAYTQADEAEDYNTKIQVYNYLDDAWFENEFFDVDGNIMRINCLGEIRFETGLLWQDIAGGPTGTTTFDAYEGSTYEEIAEATQTLAGLAGSSDGYVYLVNHVTTQDSGKNYNFRITSKSYNPYVNQGKKAKLGYVDFLVTRNDTAQFTVEFFINNNSDPYLTKIVTCDSDSVADDARDKVWRRIFVGNIGEFHNFRIDLSDEQLDDDDIARERVEIHAINMWMSPAGRLND